MTNDLRDAVFGCAATLAEHNGDATLVLDLGKLSTWTDYFVISTATSSTHLRGLARRVEEYAGEHGIPALRSPRIADDEGWCLIDFGDFVVHLMSAESRSFYELEKLWCEAEITSVSAPGGPEATPDPESMQSQSNIP